VNIVVDRQGSKSNYSTNFNAEYLLAED